MSQTVGKSDKLDNQILKNHGCVCSSTVKFSTTDSSIEKEHPEFFGLYSYKVQITITHLFHKKFNVYNDYQGDARGSSGL